MERDTLFPTEAGTPQGGLGQNVRKYGDKLPIKPARKSVKALLDKVRAVLKKNMAATRAQGREKRIVQGRLCSRPCKIQRAQRKGRFDTGARMLE